MVVMGPAKEAEEGAADQQQVDILAATKEVAVVVKTTKVGEAAAAAQVFRESLKVGRLLAKSLHKNDDHGNDR